MRLHHLDLEQLESRLGDLLTVAVDLQLRVVEVGVDDLPLLRQLEGIQLRLVGYLDASLAVLQLGHAKVPQERRAVTQHLLSGMHQLGSHAQDLTIYVDG